jgi:uncharacterized CHY-type Zn-finger protein
MSVAWIEPVKNHELKKWAYNLLCGSLIPQTTRLIFYYFKNDVLWAVGHCQNGYKCMVAEVPLDDSDTERFNLPKATCIIMSPVDRTRAIDDPKESFSIDEIQFDVEKYG